LQYIYIVIHYARTPQLLARTPQLFLIQNKQSFMLGHQDTTGVFRLKSNVKLKSSGVLCISMYYARTPQLLARTPQLFHS